MNNKEEAAVKVKASNLIIIIILFNRKISFHLSEFNQYNIFKRQKLIQNLYQ
jgi:hypothetical protein